MSLIQRILDSECAESDEYCSWEEYIRSLAYENGISHAHTDAIYPIMAFDAPRHPTKCDQLLSLFYLQVLP